MVLAHVVPQNFVQCEDAADSLDAVLGANEHEVAHAARPNSGTVKAGFTYSKLTSNCAVISGSSQLRLLQVQLRSFVLLFLRVYFFVFYVALLLSVQFPDILFEKYTYLQALGTMQF